MNTKSLFLNSGLLLVLDLGRLVDGDFESWDEGVVSGQEEFDLLSLLKKLIDNYGLPPIGSYFVTENCWKIHEYTFFNQQITISLEE